jgi:hypothetical protein
MQIAFDVKPSFMRKILSKVLQRNVSNKRHDRSDEKGKKRSSLRVSGVAFLWSSLIAISRYDFLGWMAKSPYRTPASASNTEVTTPELGSNLHTLQVVLSEKVRLPVVSMAREPPPHS